MSYFVYISAAKQVEGELRCQLINIVVLTELPIEQVLDHQDSEIPSAAGFIRL